MNPKSRLPTLVLTLALVSLPMAAPSVAEDHVVEVGGPHGLSFSPENLTIAVGDTVTWRNLGGSHNVDADDGSFRCAEGCDGEGGNGNASAASWEFSRTFNDEASISYHCDPHENAGMVGMLVVEAADPGGGGGGTTQPGTVRVAASSRTVSESAGSLNVNVERVNGTDGTVMVDFETRDGTAEDGADYSATSGTLVFGDGEAGPESVSVTILDDDVTESSETFDLVLSDVSGGASLGTNKTTVSIQDDDIEVQPCVAGPETLCLGADDRFRAELEWSATGLAGKGQTLDIGLRDGAVFFFNNPNNPEFLVKVLDGCGINKKYWVFFAATTDVQFSLTVTDTVAGEQKVYTNELGSPADAVTDVSAFETCP